MTPSRRGRLSTQFLAQLGSTSASPIPNPNTAPSDCPAQDTQASSQHLSLPQLLHDSDHSMPMESQITVPETSTQDSTLESQNNAVSQLECSEPLQLPRPPITDDIPAALSAGAHIEAERVASPPPLKSIDFAYLPKPDPLDLPVDEKWVVRLPMKGLKGNRLAAAAAKWESKHSYLYRNRGNRADPPNTFPKKWGGLTKELDEALMKYEENRISSWDRRLKEKGITPTESATSSPRSPLTQEEEEEKLEEYETNRKYAEECRRKIAAGEMQASSVIHKIRSNGVTYTASEYMKMRDERERKALADAEDLYSKTVFIFKDSADSDPSKPRPTFGMLRAHQTMSWDGDDNEDRKGKAKDETVEQHSPARSTSPFQRSTDVDFTCKTQKRKREGPKIDDDKGKTVVKTTPRKRSKTRLTEGGDSEIQPCRILPSRACKATPVIQPSHVVPSRSKPTRKGKGKRATS